jgi:hypothetical protein
MKLQLVGYRCANCAAEFKAPEIGFYSYGEFLLRSSAGEVSYLDALRDETYMEVAELLKESAKVINKTPNALADMVRKTYGAIACDPDEMGNFFEIGKDPGCRVCGCQEMAYWEVTDPPEFVDENVPPVTHVGWNMLSHADKKQRIAQVLLSTI